MVYWSIGGAIGCIVFTLSGLIAREWVKAQRLDITSISYAIVLIGIVIMLQWPTNLYARALRGLQRQVLLNLINASLETIRGIGAVLILCLFHLRSMLFLAGRCLLVRYTQLSLDLACG